MKVLVTGGAGFLGSHLVDALVDRGDSVCVLDDLSTGSRENVNDSARLVVADLAEDLTLLRIETKWCDVAFHLAAAVGVKLVVEDPVGTLRTNVRGTENVLDACTHYKKRVVITSTSEVYGRQGDDGHALQEDEQRVYGPTTARRWAYAESKAIDEFLALAYRHEHGLDVRIARLFNTVGPRQTGAYGMVLPSMVDAAVKGNPITVYGDGGQTRCFCHVADIVDGLIELMRQPNPAHEIYNLGNPDNRVSIASLAGHVRLEARSTAPHVCVPYEEVYGVGIEDMQHRTPNIQRAISDLGWRPAHTLQRIISEAVEAAQRQEEHVEAR